MHLVVGLVALPFLIHRQDAFLPLIVRGRNPESEVGDDAGEALRHPLSYCGDHHATCIGVFVSSCQLGLSFQSLEKRPRAWSDPIFISRIFFSCISIMAGVAELLLEFLDKVVPSVGIGIVRLWGRGSIGPLVDGYHQSLARFMKREVAKTTMKDETPMNWWRNTSK